jgi:threonine aldolase
MRFFSDNAAPVHPRVMAAIRAADAVDAAYDSDALSARLDAAFSALLGREAAVLWMSSGTAANALALALLCPPYAGILCHEDAHVLADECGAVEFYAGGARLIGCAGEGGKLTVATLAAQHAGIRADVHQLRPEAVTITNLTEYGRAYRADELAAIAGFCAAHGLRLHVDGARFANAAAGLGCAAADLARGIDALSFGFTKNGAMNAEALVLFDLGLAEAARRRRKRAGHLLSKGRYIAAQLLAMIEDDLWLANARAANGAARHLAQAVPDRLLYPSDGNELFLAMDAAEAAALRAQGFDFYDWRAGVVRLVTSWHHGAADVEPLARALRTL